MAGVCLHCIVLCVSENISTHFWDTLLFCLASIFSHFSSKIYALFFICLFLSVLIHLLGKGSWNLDIIKQIMAIWSNWLPVWKHKAIHAVCLYPLYSLLAKQRKEKKKRLFTLFESDSVLIEKVIIYCASWPLTHAVLPCTMTTGQTSA